MGNCQSGCCGDSAADEVNSEAPADKNTRISQKEKAKNKGNTKAGGSGRKLDDDFLKK